MGCLVYGNEILINTRPLLVHRSRKTPTNRKINQDLTTCVCHITVKILHHLSPLQNDLSEGGSWPLLKKT